MKLRLGIPKGSLQEATLSLFTRARASRLHQRALLFRRN